MSIILQCQSLSFGGFLTYPNFTIASGTVLFLQGPSGCGKSTLFRLLNATLTPDHGTIIYRGEEITDLPKTMLRQKILLCGQSTYLFNGSIQESFTAYYQASARPCPTPDEIQGFLDLCQAPFSPDTLTDTMSGGERQRVFLSIYLSLRPDILLLDEPTSALDSALATKLMDGVISFCKKQKITLLVISHDHTLATTYATQILSLKGATHE